MLNRILIALLFTSTAFAQPNIVFILTDDMSWTGTSVQIDEQIEESRSDFYRTPNIEKLADQGMCFSAAYAPGPMCTPSRAGILTGKTPAELHMTTPGGGRVQAYHKLASADFVRDLPTAETTIAEALKKQGYATAHLGKWHLGRGNPGQHGFDVHDGSTENTSNGTDTNPKDVFGITDRAIGFMEKQSKAGKPFYLQLSHYAVHVPIEALEKSKDKFQALEPGERHDSAEYAAMTWDLDTSIGILLEKIDELGLTNNTYVVLMSDNGGPGNRRQSQNLPLAGGKGSLYEGGIRVPLIVRGPGIKAGTFCRENVTGCDLLPTFCEWADFPISENIEGTSLVPLLTGTSDTFQRSEKALLFHYPHYGQGPAQKPQSAIIVENFKLIRDLETGDLQLFDLEKDLTESTNLAKKNPEKTEQLAKLLDRRLDEVGAQLPTENPNYDSDAQQPRPTRRR
ncbi:sulfatase [Pontiellaceae bacterium B12219]|nr:sulfatase [Pontiellaceae bacterium B12219]